MSELLNTSKSRLARTSHVARGTGKCGALRCLSTFPIHTWIHSNYYSSNTAPSRSPVTSRIISLHSAATMIISSLSKHFLLLASGTSLSFHGSPTSWTTPSKFSLQFFLLLRDQDFRSWISFLSSFDPLVTLFGLMVLNFTDKLMIPNFIHSPNLSSDFQRHTHLTVYLMSALGYLIVSQSYMSKTEFLIIPLKSCSSQSFLHLSERQFDTSSYLAKNLGGIPYASLFPVPHIPNHQQILSALLQNTGTRSKMSLINLCHIECLLVFNTQLW